MKTLALLMLLPSLALAAEPPAADAPAPAPASAGTPADAPPPMPAPAPYAAKFRADVRAVLRGPDFQRVEEARGLAPRPWLKRLLTREPEPEKPAKAFDFSFFAIAAQLLKVLVIVALVLALGWLLWKGWQWLAPRVTNRAPETALPPQEAQSLALAREALPDQVSRAARAAWQRGEAVLALSLLYRGAVQVLEQRYRIELPGSATEGECLRIAKRSGKAVVQSGFAPIVRAWMALAYAQRPPEDFEALARLYASHFETAGADA
jgi:hypothetical protein